MAVSRIHYRSGEAGAGAGARWCVKEGGDTTRSLKAYVLVAGQPHAPAAAIRVRCLGAGNPGTLDLYPGPIAASAAQ